MLPRLAESLVRYIESFSDGASTFILMEGIPVELAGEISVRWHDGPPKLFIASSEPERFGGRAVGLDFSGTNARNENPDGVCVVQCRGFEIKDKR